MHMFSMLWMVVGHEFVISEIVFVIGIIVAGIAYAKLPKEQKPDINTDKINKNIQTMNDILWGKKE